MLGNVLTVLHDWSVAEALRRSFYVYPVVNALHILGLGLLIGAILPVDIKLLGGFRRTPLAGLARTLVPVAAGGLLLAVATGVLLFVVRPQDYVENPAFLIKLGLVSFGTLNAIAVRFGQAWKRALADQPVAPRLRVQGAVSVMSWLAALLAGRFIAFLD